MAQTPADLDLKRILTDVRDPRAVAHTLLPVCL